MKTDLAARVRGRLKWCQPGEEALLRECLAVLETAEEREQLLLSTLEKNGELVTKLGLWEQPQGEPVAWLNIKSGRRHIFEGALDPRTVHDNGGEYLPLCPPRATRTTPPRPTLCPKGGSSKDCTFCECDDDIPPPDEGLTKDIDAIQATLFLSNVAFNEGKELLVKAQTELRDLRGAVLRGKK